MQVFGSMFFRVDKVPLNKLDAEDRSNGTLSDTVCTVNKPRATNARRRDSVHSR